MRVGVAGHLAGGEAVDERPGREVEEAGGHRVAWIAERPFDTLTPERVRPVEDDELDPRVAGGVEAVQQRAHVRVEAHAAVLQVVDERVEALEVFRGRLRLLAIEAHQGEAGLRVLAALDLLARGRAALQPVLGAEDAHDLHAVLLEHVDGMVSFRRDRGGMGDEADLLALQGRALLRVEHFQADADAARGTRGRARAGPGAALALGLRRGVTAGEGVVAASGRDDHHCQRPEPKKARHG